MKARKHFLSIALGCVLSLSAAFGLSGCADKQTSPVRSDDGPQAAGSFADVHGSMSAMVNGTQWIAGGTPAETKLDDASASVDPNTGMVTITGRRMSYHALKPDNMEEISITVKQLQPGVYQLAPDFNNFQTATFTRGIDKPTTYFIQEKQSGSLIITRVDSAEHRIYGTFHFTCRDSKGEDMDVSDGTFDNVRFEPPVIASVGGTQ